MKNIELIVLIGMCLLMFISIYIFAIQIRKMNGSDEQEFKAARAKRRVILTGIAFVAYSFIYYVLLK